MTIIEALRGWHRTLVAKQTWLIREQYCGELMNAAPALLDFVEAFGLWQQSGDTIEVVRFHQVLQAYERVLQVDFHPPPALE